MSEEQYIYVDFPPNDPLNPLNPIDFIGRTVVVISTRKKWYSDGSLWEQETGAASSVGSLDANSPIAGNPAGLQTPAELAATIQAQAAQIAALQAFLKDADLDGRLDAASQQSNEYDFPVPQLQWNIAHNLGKRATVILLDNTGEQFISETVYSDLNTLIIRHSTPTAGKAILQ